MKAMDVAAHVINRCIETGRPITNLKLQKILYFLDMTFLVQTEERLIDDNFEAWQYGPVVPAVYRNFSMLAASPIIIKQEFQEKFPDNYLDRLNNKIDSLADTPAWDLVEKSHKKDTPWYKTFYSGSCNKEISTELMNDFAKEIRSNKK